MVYSISIYTSSRLIVVDMAGERTTLQNGIDSLRDKVSTLEKDTEIFFTNVRRSNILKIKKNIFPSILEGYSANQSNVSIKVTSDNGFVSHFEEFNETLKEKCF